MQIDHFLSSPLSGSKKIYLNGKLFPTMRIPVREIGLANNANFFVYDTSGPYTDETMSVDLTLGLPDVRSSWINTYTESCLCQGSIKFEAPIAEKLQRIPRKAKVGQTVTQLYYARRGYHHT